MQTVTGNIAERYLEYIEKIENVAPSTVKNRQYIIKPFLRWYGGEIANITLQDIDSYLIKRSTEIKKSSIGAERQCFRSFFRYCQEYLEMNMLFRWEVIQRKKDKPGLIRVFTREEIVHVVSSCTVVQDKLIISLLFETGIRIGELLRLKASDILGTQIHIRGKGDYDRLVYMSPRLAAAIRSHTAYRSMVDGFVFRPLQQHKNHPNDRYVSAYGVRDRIERIFKQWGHDMHPHQLRHSFAVNWITQGGDIRTLQILLGHSSIETTQLYLRFSDAQTHSTYHQVMSSSVLDEM